jgi:hypothetical protein
MNLLFTKIFSIARWFVFAILLQIILIPLAYFFYVPAYLLRKPLRKGYYGNTILLKLLSIPLWIFLDDEALELSGDEYGEIWWKKANNIDISKLNEFQKFIVAYKWAVIRNPAWNQYELLKPKQGSPKFVDMYGYTSGEWNDFCVLKWEIDGQYSDNMGQCVSRRYSIFGNLVLWYKVEDKLYWRYSYANKFLGRWFELHLGTNDKRYTVRFKIKKADICPN